MEKKKSMFNRPNRPDIICLSVKDHRYIVVKPQSCAKTGRMYKFPEADSMENITSACVRNVRNVECLLCILRQVHYTVTESLHDFPFTVSLTLHIF